MIKCDTVTRGKTVVYITLKILKVSGTGCGKATKIAYRKQWQAGCLRQFAGEFAQIILCAVCAILHAF